MSESAVLSIVIVVMELLFTASVVAVISNRLRFPFTIGLVIIGLFIGWLARVHPSLQPLFALRLTPDIVLFVFLPVLLFESAFNLDVRSLMKNLPAIFMMAVPALLISTMTVGVLLHYFLGLPLPVALLFGALISATDPVAVVALFKEMGAPKRLYLLVEGESLFNDGTALVVFKIMLGIVLAGSFTGSAIAGGVLDFLLVAIGGTFVGITMGVAFSKMIERVWSVPLVEIALSTVLAHGSFIVAEHFLHVSGVIATVTAGLTLGSFGRNKISPGALEHMESFWEYFAFVCNSLIFLLVGLSVDLALLGGNVSAIMLGTLIVIAARAVAVYSAFPAVGYMRLMEGVSKAFQTVIFWGGLRGALAIVMALSIPDSVELKPFLLTLTLGIVLTNLLLNGLTVKPLMVFLGLDQYSARQRLERLQAMLEAKRETMQKIAPFSAREGIDADMAVEKKRQYSAEVERLDHELKSARDSVDAEEGSALVMIRCLMLEKSIYQRFFEHEMLSEEALKELVVEIERHLDLMREGVDVFSLAPLSVFERLADAVARVPLVGGFVRSRRAGMTERVYEKERARLSATTMVLKSIGLLRSEGVFLGADAARVERIYNDLRDRAVVRMEAIWKAAPAHVDRAERRLLDKFCLRSELQAYGALYSKGALEEKIYIEIRDDLQKRLRKS